MYWIIKGVMQARQRILEFEEVRHEDGIRRCGIVLAPELVPVAPPGRCAHSRAGAISNSAMCRLISPTFQVILTPQCRLKCWLS